MTIYDLDKLKEWLGVAVNYEYHNMIIEIEKEIMKIEKEADDMTAKLNTREK
jgi:hypothetical protein